MNCIYSGNACVVCGISSRRPDAKRNCIGRKSDDPPKPGLGDMVAAGLSAIGITKERVSAVVGGDCGCHKRQEALNELGRKIGIG
jgi:hypothetical protein